MPIASKMLRRVSLVAIVLNLSGCAPTLPRAPTVLTAEQVAAADSRFVLAEGEAPAGLDEGPAAAETIVPGDVLTLHIRTIPEIEQPGTRVDDTGAIHIPLAGSVHVGGLTLDEAEEAVSAAMRSFDRLATTSITLSDPAGHRASVVGVVASPGVYPLGGALRVADLLALAGGARQIEEDGEVGELADLAAARLVRDGTAMPVSIVRALEGDPRHNVRVRAGNLLFIPAAHGHRITVLGSVRTARTVAYRSGLRLSEAIGLAGGTTVDAELGDVRVVRGPLSAPEVYTASISALVSGEGADVELAPGDIVFVTEHWLAAAGRVLQRLAPLLGTAALVAGFSR